MVTQNKWRIFTKEWICGGTTKISNQSSVVSNGHANFVLGSLYFAFTSGAGLSEMADKALSTKNKVQIEGR